MIFFLPGNIFPHPKKCQTRKNLKFTKMSFIGFYRYLVIFFMLGRHVPLGERDSACGREILPVEEVYCYGREILPVGEGFCLWKSCIAMGERFSLWKRCIPLGETDSPSGGGVSLWERLIHLGGLYSLNEKEKSKMESLKKCNLKT